jgi:hypothetical protein
MDILWKIIVVILGTLYVHLINYYVWARDFKRRKLYCIIIDVVLIIVSILVLFVFND